MPSARALLLLASAATAALAAPTDPLPPNCVVPQVLYDSLPNSFTLSALDPADASKEGLYHVNLKAAGGPSNDEVPKLDITKIASTQYQLRDNALLANGVPARGQPGIQPDPLPLQGFAFGEGDAAPLRFSASYTCDAAGKLTLRLNPPAEEGVGFGVEKIENDQQVYIRPEPVAGTSIGLEPP